MSAHLQTLLLALTIGAVYWWLHSPTLSYYSLQIFAFVVALYFVHKRLSKAKIWHLAPAHQSYEMILATFAFLLIIGYTGNFDSPLYALTYVHLFFLVFSTQVSTSITISLLLLIFHYALSGVGHPALLSELLTIPLLAAFFLFAKHQYEEVLKEKRIIEGEEEALSNSLESQRQMSTLLADFVQPKLAQIKEMSLNADRNRAAIMGQILILQMEISKFLGRQQNEG